MSRTREDLRNFLLKVKEEDLKAGLLSNKYRERLKTLRICQQAMPSQRKRAKKVEVIINFIFLAYKLQEW